MLQGSSAGAVGRNTAAAAATELLLAPLATAGTLKAVCALGGGLLPVMGFCLQLAIPTR